MYITSRAMRTAAAALMAVSVAATAIAPAIADTASKKQETLIDRTATGSIQPRAAPDCSLAENRADIVCRIAGGDRAPKFPSAPVNPAFGL
jgi:hypothetical protein